MDKINKACVPCPECGEDDIDRLIWTSNSTIECLSCDCQYDPDDYRKVK